MKDPTDYTPGELEMLMVPYLVKRGRSDEYIAGYLEAQKLSGWLRPACPAWIRNSAALWYLIPRGLKSYKKIDALDCPIDQSITDQR